MKILRVLVCFLFLIGFVATSWGQVPPQPNSKIWARTEYLLWWVKGADLPALVTTGPVNVNDPSDRSGELGRPDTRVLLGNEPVGFDTSPGGRVVLGGWTNETHRIGIEASYLFLNRGKAGATLSAPGTPGSMALLLPFFNPVTGLEDSTGLAIPTGTGFSGIANLTLSTKMGSAEVNGLWNVFRGGEFRVDALAGYRHLDLDEEFLFTTDSANIPPAPRDVFLTRDDFRTRNRLHAGQIGARSEWRHGLWSLDAAGKVAFGSMRQSTSISGALNTNDFNNLGPVQIFPGGYFALPTNIGSHERHHFAMVPETTAQVGWSLHSRLRLLAGYTFVFASSVARPGEEIDRTINPSQGPGFTGDPSQTLVGPARPVFPARDGTFWAQSLNFGAEFRF